jgi:diguanylate cyclase (GGDEF)-like protein
MVPAARPHTERLEPARLVEACNRAAHAAASTGDPVAAIEAALDALSEELGSSALSALALEHGRLWIVGTRGYTMLPDGIDPQEGVTGRAVREGVPQYVPDVAADPDYLNPVEGITSELALPLSTADGIIGVLNIETAELLPPDAARLTGPLSGALAPVVEALRSVRLLDLSSLARFFVFVGSLRDPGAIAEVTARALARTLPLETCQVVVESDGLSVETATWQTGRDAPRPLGHAAVAALEEHVGAAVFDLVDVAQAHMPELAGSGVHAAVVLPLRANGEDVGVAVGTSRSAIEFDRHQAEAATLIGAHAAASIDAAVALSRERRHAHTDSLTGILNRRGFEQVLDAALEHAQEERLSLGLVVFDCDDFKEINDRAGHEFGDALLREIGLVLPGVLPADARAARLGGDEFVVVLPGADADEGEALAKVLHRDLVEGLAEAGFPLHVSLGVSTYPFDGGSGSQLVRAADQALYEAKSAGKGRVVGFREVVRRGASPPEGTDLDGADRRRGQSRPDANVLVDVLEAGRTIWDETTVDGVLTRLAKASTFVVGATGCAISRVEGPRLTDVVFHALRDVDMGEQVAYLIEEFPVTAAALATGTSRALSFLDEDLDRSEAFVLRELRMNACLLVPLLVHGRAWGLVEVYDMRLRRFSRDERAAADFLAAQAGRRIESLGDAATQRRKLWRLPSAD